MLPWRQTNKQKNTQTREYGATQSVDTVRICVPAANHPHRADQSPRAQYLSLKVQPGRGSQIDHDAVREMAGAWVLGSRRNLRKSAGGRLAREMDRNCRVGRW